MEMLLLGACLSLFGLAVACLAFGAATRSLKGTAEAASVGEQDVVRATSARFFVATPPLPADSRTRVPIEVLLLQIENHVRLEQAAAEGFLESPDPSRLHSRTASPLLN